MRYLTSVLLFALCASGFSQTIAWKESLNDAKKASAASKKLILLEFYGETCFFCQKMDSDVYTNKKVVDAVGKFVPVKVQPAYNAELAKKYKLIGTPIMYILDENEKIWGHISGPVDPDYFIKLLNEIAELKRDVQKIKSDAERKGDVESLARLALSQAYQCDLDAAKATFGKAVEKSKGSKNDLAAHAGMVLGQAMAFQGRLRESEPFFSKAHELVKDSVETSMIRSWLGSYYMILGKKDEAIKYFDMVVRMKGSTEIDRWCADYQLRILRG